MDTKAAIEQLRLLEYAEQALGPRDTSWEIKAPRFYADGPRIELMEEQKFARAWLSLNAQGYFPTLIRELAHETVHLLNPVRGCCSTWLGEGVAEVFSIYAQKRYDLNPQKIKTYSYHYAFNLVSKLGTNPLVSGRKIRDKYGRFADVTPEDLVTLFPNVEHQILVELCEQFDRGRQEYP